MWSSLIRNTVQNKKGEDYDEDEEKKQEDDENKKEATYLRRPERSELNADINEALIVEYYNR